MFKVNNRSIKHCSGVFDVNFEYIWHVVVVFFFVVVDFEHANFRWNSLLPQSKFTQGC